ncbi:MAG: NAD-dependent epimerase/dehydratase family protein [Elainellaceae cyanobacterium]
MTSQRIFITGASGCIGHYIVSQLIEQTDHELFLLVRSPEKLKVDCDARPGIHVLQGNMKQIHKYADLLKTINTAILTAAAWGDPIETYDVNVVKTLELLNLLDLETCQQVIYFSTASILGHDNQPLKAAGELGTDYIRTKFICHQSLSKVAIAPRITTVFPTLVFGGDGKKPYSFLSAGFADLIKHMNLIRFFRTDGSFHFIHAYDIAQVIGYLVEHPPAADQPRKLVLGNPALTVNQAIREISLYLNKSTFLRIPLFPQLAELFIILFRIQMAPWDRFSLSYRHFTYESPVNPSRLGLSPYCETVADLMRVHGVGDRRRTSY